MDKSKFLEQMEKHGVAYITYVPDTPFQGRKTSFVVATTEFNDPHIKRVESANTKLYGFPHPEVLEGEVLVYSYSKDKFRTLPLNSIKKVSSLSLELNRATLCFPKKS